MDAKTKIITKKEKATNRYWKNFVDKQYLGSHNLEVGEEMLLTIAKFEGEELVQKIDGKNNEKVAKQVLYFKEDVPKMILNITNGNTLSNLYGSHPDQWVGKKIQLYAASVKAFGKTQDALRIRDFVPQVSVDVSSFKKKLDACKDLDELAKVWRAFPPHVRENSELFKAKEELKAILTSASNSK
ncbi:MAG: hypothetical protein ACEQSB_06765 [Undibacterium sp.]